MITASLLLLLPCASPTNERVLDAFVYANDAAARAAWVADGKTPPVAVVRERDRGVLEFLAPFAAQAELERTTLDRRVDLDLSSVGEFTLEMAADDPRAVGHVSLYFRSGEGWYAGSGGLVKSGRQKLRFSKAAFRVEGRPAGWHKIDGVRISIWRGQAVDSKVRLGRLAAVWNDVALVVPAAAQQSRSEYQAARRTAESVGDLLSELGLGADAIDDVALRHGALKGRSVAILAHHPGLDEDAAGALEEFIAKGGKVLACYHLPPRLAKALGFGKTKYVGQKQPGQFAEMRFTATDIPGLPKSVRQASWNITAAEPVARHARVIGQWFDADGQPTGLPAMLLSDHGAFLTHVLLTDDRAGKRQLLGAILGRLSPALWQHMADAATAGAQSVGHCEDFGQLGQHVTRSPVAGAVERLQEATQALALAKELALKKSFAEAVEAARKARELAAEAYLRAQPSPIREGRAFWNHSGTGAYAGDWDRTAKELAGAGFNMVLPNMLWGGLAHYPSDFLPRSATLREHGDQIAQCVAAAKKYGLEVHVWKVNYNLSTAPKEFVEEMRGAKRTQVSHAGEPHNWLCPSHPENLKLELDSMLEVARKYDVDGLHFDYIRYPDGSHCYCDGCRERFEAASGAKVARWPADCYRGDRRQEYRDWRCTQITRLVEAVSREAKQIKPRIKISAAVFGAYPECRESVGQDWVAWIQAGYLDFVCPMDYAKSDLQFVNLLSNQLKLVEGRIPVYPGIGAWQLSSADRAVGQIHHARQLGAPGFTLFNLDAGAAQTLLPAVRLGAGAERAVPPHRK